MKIHFTKKEYRLLLDMILIADWVLNAHAVEEEELKATERYQAIGQKIMSFAKEAGCEDLAVFDKTLEMYFGTGEYEMEGEYMEFVQAFEDENFWQQLAQRLAERDFLEETPESVGEKMKSHEIVSRIEELKEPYGDEFSEHGIDHLKIVKMPENIIH